MAWFAAGGACSGSAAQAATELRAIAAARKIRKRGWRMIFLDLDDGT
jgi:hypothetical protein